MNLTYYELYILNFDKEVLNYKPHMNKLEDLHHQLKENACRNVTTV